MQELLLREHMDGGVTLLRINRPEVRNALNLALRQELARAFTELGQDEATGCIVITGDSKAFCAGADLAEYVDADPAEIASRNMPALWGAISRCPKPIIAAVNGYALGGGCELAMHADIIIAGGSAQFGQPEALIGLIPGGGATQRLTRAVGKYIAMQILLTGERFTATRAYEMGLVNRVVTDSAVLEEALIMARHIASMPPRSVQYIKELVLESMSSPLEFGLRAEQRSFQNIFGFEEKTRRIRRFLKKS